MKDKLIYLIVLLPVLAFSTIAYSAIKANSEFKDNEKIQKQAIELCKPFSLNSWKKENNKLIVQCYRSDNLIEEKIF